MKTPNLIILENSDLSFRSEESAVTSYEIGIETVENPDRSLPTPPGMWVPHRAVREVEVMRVDLRQAERRRPTSVSCLESNDEL